MAARYELFKDRKDGWRFRLKAPNGEIITISESYSSKQMALNGIKVMKRDAEDAPIEIIEEAKKTDKNPKKDAAIKEFKEIISTTITNEKKAKKNIKESIEKTPLKVFMPRYLG